MKTNATQLAAARRAIEAIAMREGISVEEVRREIKSPNRQLRIDLCVINAKNGVRDVPGRRCLSRQVCCSVGVLGDLPSIAVCHGLAVVTAACGVFNVISHRQGQLIRYQLLFQQIQRDGFRHLPYNQPCFLKGIRAYYSNKEQGKILMPNRLIENTYKYMINYTCGLGDMEPGTANYLCGKSLTGNTTDDNYTSFSSEEGQERLYAYMHRLCVPEPLPQNIPPLVSEDGYEETNVFYPKTSRDRVTVTATLLLQPGQTLTLESSHGGTGTIEAEESTPSGRRRQSKKGEEADTN